MAQGKSAWGVEVGAYALKAVRLERDGDNVEVTDFTVIPHKKVLSTPDIDQDELIRLSLGQFISQKELEGEQLIFSVPGHTAFARFAKLPPVEPKKVPDIVKFEAVQQIPFPINEVEWDYEVFATDDSPEVEVGIFAMTRERVQQRLVLYSDVDLSPDALTLGPVAAFNAMHYDHHAALAKGPLVYLDIGTHATDVIVVEEGRCWIRTFPLGGTHFTEAIAEAFKLSYSKAEKLKYEAATSKYAKQIMQAMRPVFSDLLQEVQRSIGYYQSLHRDADLQTVVGLGSTFKIPGLRKFLGQQLQLNVLRLDEYKRIAVQGREAASFAESAVNMATAYGLALQGVGLAKIAVNLVPTGVLREQLWRGKAKWFAAAAAVVVAAGAINFYHPLAMKRHLHDGGLPPEVSSVLNVGNQLRSEAENLQQKGDIGFSIENYMRLADYRWVWPHLIRDVTDALASSNPQPALLGEDIEAILAIPPAERRLIQLRNMHGQYVPPADNAGRRIRVTMEVELSRGRPIEFINETVEDWLREHAEREGHPYRIIPDSVRTEVTQMQRLRVNADGTLEGDSDRPGRRQPSGTGRPSGRPPMQGGGTGSAPGAPGATGSGGSSGAGSMGAPDDPTPAPGAPSATDPSQGRSDDDRRPGPGRGSGGIGTPPRPGQSGASQNVKLDEIAPLPSSPSLYPPGSDFVRVPIYFEIELLEPERSISADQVADRTPIADDGADAS